MEAKYPYSSLLPAGSLAILKVCAIGVICGCGIGSTVGADVSFDATKLAGGRHINSAICPCKADTHPASPDKNKAVEVLYNMKSKMFDFIKEYEKYPQTSESRLKLDKEIEAIDKALLALEKLENARKLLKDYNSIEDGFDSDTAMGLIENLTKELK